MPSWNPVLNARNAALPFLLAGFVFVPVGVAVFLTTSRLQEYQFDYTECRQVNTNKTCASVIAKEPSKSCVCYEIITLPEDFQQSVNVYYGLTSYYQNFRFYVQSRDDKQLLGHPLSARYACKPYDVDAKGYAIFPCGAIANSLFNDTFKLRHKVGTNYRDVELSTENITWPLDHERKFRNPIIELSTPASLPPQGTENHPRSTPPPARSSVSRVTTWRYAVSYVGSDCGSFMTTKLAVAAHYTACAHLSPPALKPRARCLVLKRPATMTRGERDCDTTSCAAQSVDFTGLSKNLSGTVKPHNWPLPVDQIPGGLQNEAFIVWMRTAALPSLRKLYGRIASSGDFARVVPRGEYYLEVHYRYRFFGLVASALGTGTVPSTATTVHVFLSASHPGYPVTGFGGTKRLILSNASWMGSRNPFIAIAYVCVGCLCVALGLAFVAVDRRFGSTKFPMPEISDFEKHRQVWRARKPSLMPLPQPRSASKAGRPPSKSSLR
ncbi:hypothetical protein HPB51_006821 [Rhipicephalus microplus]|uniref:Cell cycle control protein 50A n=1 Tax=Rhipicephalus microplus TaxID=6941 RepID=A0A9J6E8H2_RHIMP|nr:hypothetical protein HPB51_006821 [Rhipicephalus microplus]